MKKPILQNNFDSESGGASDGAKTAKSSRKNAPKTTSEAARDRPADAPNASDSPSRVGRGPGEGSDSPSRVGPALSLPKGRGPRTSRGKRAISRNAIKHAIFSSNPVVIAGLETIEEWEQFESEVAESWSPVGRYERELAYDIAYGLRRLQRCRFYEAALLSGQAEKVEEKLIEDANDEGDDGDGDDDDEDVDAREDESQRPSYPVRRVDPARLRAHQLLAVIPDGYSIDLILRYETHVRRALVQTVHELEACQSRRLGEQLPLARVQFNSGPSLRRETVRGSSAFDKLNEDLGRAERGLARRRRARRQPHPAGDEDTA